MPLDLSDTLVIGITSTALFDLNEADAIFRAKIDTDPEAAIDEYRAYMEERETESLGPGTGFHLVKALMGLNEFQPESETPLIQVVVMSRNSPETGVRVFHNIREQKLDITRSAFTGGESVVDYLDAYDVDLFLTTSPIAYIPHEDSEVSVFSNTLNSRYIMALSNDESPYR